MHEIPKLTAWPLALSTFGTHHSKLTNTTGAEPSTINHPTTRNSLFFASTRRGAANGFKIKDNKAMEEEEKAEEQAPFESAEQSGGNQTELLTQTDFSNVDQQAYSNAVEIDPPPSTITMEDDNADEPSLHFEDDLEEAGMDEAPGSSILDAKLGGSLRQVSFHKDLCIAGSHDSLKDVSYHNHDTSTQGSSSCNDQTEMGDSMTSMNSNHVEQLKPISDSSAPDDAKTFVKNKKRVSLVVDIESGKEGARAQTALIRDQSQCRPSSVGARRRRGVKHFLSNNTLRNPLWGHAADESDKEHSDDSMKLSVDGRLTVPSPRVVVDDLMEGDMSALETPESQRKPIETQYRLQALAPGTGKLRHMARGFGFSVGSGAYEEPTMSQGNVCSCFGLDPNKTVIRYLNWAFRSSFVVVFFSAAAAFFGLCTGFAILIYLSGMNNPNCIHVNGVEFGTTGADFSDAFALSWTTFSTVGYGLIHPATSTTNEEVRRQCTGITVLTTMESFVGILFASVCGAIVFAKVTRIASFAQVIFSDAIVIRYGDGVSNVENDENSDNDEARKSQEMTLSKLPCPLLEFRVINRLHTELGGEIIDATMNIVASIDERQASHALRNAANNTRRRGKKGKRRRGMSKKKLQTSQEFKPVSQHKYNGARDSLTTMFVSAAKNNNQRMDEDPSGMIVPRRIFSKLEIESPEHPFFKRVWLARHTLDHHSPLLRQEARELVRLNGGHWPHELNNAEAVRASVQFDQIVVSLSGTSNVDANSVYAQKIYDFVDICIGYRFVNLLYRDERDGSLALDPTLLNDVTEQNGGGGENLNAVKENSFIV